MTTEVIGTGAQYALAGDDALGEQVRLMHRADPDVEIEAFIDHVDLAIEQFQLDA
jgi:hypothetical protein